jgi:hypothetical protein
MSNPPAGWYPDPTGQPHTIRWWDGAQWTTQTEKEVFPEADAAQAVPFWTQPTSTPSEATGDEGEAPATGHEAGGASGMAAAGAGVAISAAEKAKAAWTQGLEAAAANRPSAQQQNPDNAEPTNLPTASTKPSIVATSPASDEQAASIPRQAAAAQAAPDQPQTAPVQAVPDRPVQAVPDLLKANRTQAVPDGRKATGVQAVPDQQQATGAARAGGAQGGVAQGNAAGAHEAAANQWQAAAAQQGVVSNWQTTHGIQGNGAGSPPDSGQWQMAGGGPRAGAGQAGQWSGRASRGIGGGQRGTSGPSRLGARTTVIVTAAGVLVLIVVAAVFLVVNRGDDQTADPSTLPSAPTSGEPSDNSSTAPTTSTAPTAPASTRSNGQDTFAPGQSKNPKLHQGARISSDAISFPRQQPPWSDRKRLVPQLLNSSGQYVLLQENVAGEKDWYADIFVGALGTDTLFDGNVQATASQLSIQVRSAMYRDVPATFKALRNGPVQRTGRSGWYYQQSVTANSPTIAARALTLTVAVFDLGDGTAVAYISDIPTNRPDLRTAESQVYKGINVG